MIELLLQFEIRTEPVLVNFVDDKFLNTLKLDDPLQRSFNS